MIKFKDYECNVEWDLYQNGRPAILLVDAHDGSPVATATVNIPEVDLPAGYTLIKDYSENEGMLECLATAGIVQPTGHAVGNGFVVIPVCSFHPEAI